MARGFLEFRERKGLGRKPIQKTSCIRGCSAVSFSHLREVCCPIVNSVAFWWVVVKHRRWIIRLLHKPYQN